MIDISRMTLKQKIISMVMMISALTLILGSIAFVINDRYTARDTMGYIMDSQANLVGTNSTAALLFGDQAAAQENLNSLSKQKHVVAAAIYTKKGKTFASFNKHTSHQHTPRTIDSNLIAGYKLSDHTIDIFQPIILDEERLGSIYISASLDELYANVINYSGIIVALLIATLGLALYISSQLQHAATKPIRDILNTTSKVSTSGNYALRIQKNTHDEIGDVVDGINDMLDQIQQRDEQLESHANELEHKVAERTHELELLTDQFRHQAYHDELTNLPNRALFLERVNFSISQAKRLKQNHAIIFFDMDGFKAINDALGHDIGDELLIEVAKRLTKSVRDSDTVSRLGGDEFTLLLNDVTDIKSVQKMAGKLLDILREPLLCHGREVLLSASLGISLFPKDTDNAIDLMKYADTAMYEAKKRGKNNFQFYSAAIHNESLGRLTLENGLRSAINNDELVLHYQPKVNVRQKTVTGVEILLRWQHPEKGLLHPSSFIDVAEETGLIIPIGQWVLQEACQHSEEWKTGIYEDINVALNLSVIQLYQEDLVSTLSTCMAERKMDPSHLQLELTESMVMSEVGRDREVLMSLKDLGVSLAIDDFGTGYSCLSQLRNLPIDTVKIDRSFIHDLGTDMRANAVIQAIIALSEAMKLNVVAEGVETEAEVRQLVELGCDELQGYYFAKPVPSHELKETFVAIESKLETLNFPTL